MNARARLAIGILAAWGAGIGAFAYRELARTPRERLAAAAARIAPGATYFAVERDGRHVGFASSTIDTVPGGLQVTDFLVADLPLRGALQRATAQSLVHLSRALALRDFTILVGSDSLVLRADGRLSGDTALSYVVQAPATPADTTRRQLAGPLLLPTIVPLAIMLGDEPEVGRESVIDTFDPVTMSVRALPVSIRAESLFVLVDSAAFDAGSRRWSGVHSDTVRGFHLTATNGDAFDAWVDATGRMIAVRAPGGLTLKRTAYELAFENWRNASPLRTRSPVTGHALLPPAGGRLDPDGGAPAPRTTTP